MKKLSKVLSIFLCFTMLVGFVPFSAKAITQTATLVTDFNQLSAGDQIVILNETKKFIMGVQTNTYRSKVDLSDGDFTDNAKTTLTIPDAAAIITLVSPESSLSGYYLKVDNSYLNYGSGNSISTETTATDTWSFGTDVDNYHTINNVQSTDRFLQYNSGNPRFACYKNTQQSLWIYKVNVVSSSECQHSTTEQALDATQHWEVCTSCGAQTSAEKNNHTYVNGGLTCDANCGAFAAGTNNTYIIASGSSAMTAITTSYGYPVKTEVTIADTEVSGHTQKQLWTITNVEGGVTIQDWQGYYYYSKSAYQSINRSENALTDGSGIWSITKSGSSYVVKNTVSGKTLGLFTNPDPDGSSFGVYDMEDSTFSGAVTELTILPATYTCQHTGFGTQYKLNATQHWQICSNCGEEIPESSESHDASACLETPCADCGFAGNYAILAGDRAMMVYTGTKTSDYMPSIQVSVNGSTITGASDITASDLTFMLVQTADGITIQDSQGRYLRTKASYNGFYFDSTVAYWTRTGDKFTITVPGDSESVTKTMAYGGGSYTTFGVYADPGDRITKIDLILNPTYQKQTIQLSTIEEALAASTGNFMVSGAITHIDDKNFYIQDSTGAICARFTTAPSGLNVGDWITVTGSRSDWYGLPQLSDCSAPTPTTGTALTPSTTTLDAVKVEDICEYITITGLTVSIEGGKYYLSFGDTKLQWAKVKLPEGVTLLTGDKLDFTGAIGISGQNPTLRNTIGTEITNIVSHDHQYTWDANTDNHWQVCSVCGTTTDPHSNSNLVWDTTTVSGKHFQKCECGYSDQANACDGEVIWVKNNADEHWQECTKDGCGYTSAHAAHVHKWVAGTEDHVWTCETCGNTKTCTGSLVWTTGDNGHYQKCSDTNCGYQTTSCSGELKWVSTDASQHWHACSVTGCGYTTEKKDHDHKTLVNKNDGTHVPTCECGHTEAAVAHNYEGRPYSKAANKQHYQTCACGQTSAFENCLDGDDADEKCDKCGQNLACDHTDTTPKHNETHHWDECTNPDCGEHLNEVEHTLSPQKDADYHWKGCTCGYEIDKAEHTLTAKASDTHHWTACECGHKTAEVAHEFLTTKSNTTHHWTECSCGAKTANVAHEYTSKYNGTHHWTECACGVKTAEALHEFTANHNDTHHWTECSCGAKTTETAHTLTYQHDNAQHWQVCDCGYASAKADHTLTDNKCACGYEKSAAPDGSAGQVTNSSTLAVGDKVVIGTGEMVMSNVHEKGNYHLGIEGAAADGYVLIGDGMVIVTLEAGASEGTFALKTDGGYLCSAGEKNNYLKLSDTVDAASSWKIEILHTGEAVITNVDQPNRTIRWNAQSPRFATYRSGQTAVFLYEVGAAYTPGNAPADPAPTDPKEIVDAAFALGAGEKLPYNATLTGVITAVDEEGYSESFGNITVTISVEGTSGTKSLVAYRMVATTATKDQIAGLAVGDTITVSGSICNYEGTIEFAASCTLDAVVKGQTPVDPPVDPVDPPVDPVDPPVDPVDPPVEPEEPAGIADGTYVIFNPAHKITLSTTYNGFYNNGVEGVVQDSTLSGFTAAEVWTVKNNDDGTITISCANGVLSQSTYSSMGMDLENNTWVLESAGNGQYYVKNVGTGKYMEWYAEKNNWSTYYIDDKTDTSLFALQFCPVNADGTTAEIPKTGDTISVIFALMLVSLMGTAVILKKKQF